MTGLTILQFFLGGLRQKFNKYYLDINLGADLLVANAAILLGY